MKAQRIVMLKALVIMFLIVTSFTGVTVVNAQEDTMVIHAIYDGHEDYGYNFIATRNDEEYTITFQEVKKEVLEAFDLDSDTLLNKKFKITYTVEMIVTIDDDGNEDEEEVNTIVKLEKL
ncbi:hypothetical protein [Aestuariivivens insulae]|uniref:hypothetical protein n=1 Tax=Aestuariivivens insulae TaxID=1621988 RepID=UPI001F5959D9|nr:hypothetical protein [Aestuariivivens insulae]